MGATPPRFFHRSFGNYAHGLKMCVWFVVTLSFFFFFFFLLFFVFFFHFFVLFNLDFFFRCDMMTWVACGAQLLLQFNTKLFETCRCFCHILKMYICFWGLSSYYFVINFFPLFRLLFQVRLSTGIRIDNSWAQLILQFSTDHLN